MGSLANLVRVTSATVGTGTLTLGSAVSGFLTPVNAGMVNGQPYSYAIEADYVTVGDDIVPTSREVGWGIYTVSGSTLTRNVVNSTNSNALLALPSGDAQVIICVTTETALGLAAKNLLLNGAMEVSQEFGTTAQTGVVATRYCMDMFSFNMAAAGATFTLQQVADAPPGLKYSIKASVTAADVAIAASDFYTFSTPVEGYRIGRLGFGAASPSAVALGFWVKAHRLGVYSGSIRNGAAARSYTFEFTVNVIDTWEYKTVSIAGDASGTWSTDNTVQLTVNWALAVGSTFQTAAGSWTAGSFVGTSNNVNGVGLTSDTFQISGVSFVQGSVPVPQEHSMYASRPFDEELALCQRYYEKSYDYTVAPGTISASGEITFRVNPLASGALTGTLNANFKVRKRSSSSAVWYSPTTGTSNRMRDRILNADVTPSDVESGEWGAAAAATTGTTTQLFISAHFVADSRL